MSATRATLAQAMPALALNEGVWEGWYRYFEAPSGKLLDEHRSRLTHRLGDDGGYSQSNDYFWPDGRTDKRNFSARYAEGRIWFDNELIEGWCAESPLDATGRTSFLYWTRKGEKVELYEMIQNADDGMHRARTWQWLRDGVCFQRTLIDEVRVSRDWRTWQDSSAPKN